MNGVETFVLENLNKKDLSWIPSRTSVTVEIGQAAESVGNEHSLDGSALAALDKCMAKSMQQFEEMLDAKLNAFRAEILQNLAGQGHLNHDQSREHTAGRAHDASSDAAFGRMSSAALSFGGEDTSSLFVSSNPMGTSSRVSESSTVISPVGANACF